MKAQLIELGSNKILDEVEFTGGDVVLRLPPDFVGSCFSSIDAEGCVEYSVIVESSKRGKDKKPYKKDLTNTRKCERIAS